MKQKKRILMRVDSTSEMGTGHVMRCMALSQYCLQNNGEIHFASCSQIKNLQHTLPALFSYREFPVKMGSLDDANQTLELAKEIKTKVVIVDGYHFSKDYIDKLASNNIKVILISDFELTSDNITAIINQNLYADACHYPSHVKQFLGLKYLLLRKEFWQYKNFYRISTPVVKKILVTMGGSDFHNLSLKIFQILENFRQYQLDVTFILGVGYPYYEKIKEMNHDTFHRYTFVQNVQNISDYMREAQLAITAGGSTCWELVVMQLASLIVVMAENQEKIAQKMTSCGYGVSLGWYDAPYFEEKLINELESIISNPNKLNQMQSKMKITHPAHLTPKLGKYLTHL